MADFFGGILDSLRGTMDTAHDFLGGPSLGTDIATGIAGGGTPQNSAGKLLQANAIARMDNVPTDQRYSPTRNVDKSNEGKALSYEQVEQSWLMRLRRFSQIDSELQAGKVNEGKPQ